MVSAASSIIQLFTSHWVSAVLSSAVELEVFEYLRGVTTLTELHARTGVPVRSLQALLDGLVAIGLVTTDGPGRYANSDAAETHLVRGKPGYLGGYARIISGAGDGGMRQWSQLVNALKSGKPIKPETIVEPDSPFWPELVKVLTPLSREVAAIAADLLGVSGGAPMSVLDVGGGAGAYSEVWLGLNPRARVTQLDWAPVNALARESLAPCAFGDRFVTLDGDLHSFEFAAQKFDVVILSNICHHESPEGNVDLFRRVRLGLEPGGHLVVSEFVLHDDRKGPAFAALFGAGMVLQTPNGASYSESEYQAWLASAGFERARVDRSHPLSTLFIARG
ncbi:MAG TPA: methyltransferase [Polyangiaceae bacterium]|nr:methyltransferase [Polyangiaceae bacterium]